METPSKRKRIFVDREVQGILIRRLVCHWLIAGGLLFLYLSVMQMFASQGSQTVSEHLGSLWERYAPLLVAIVTLFPVFAYDSVKLSHRFAGPMVSFRTALNRLANGQSVRPLRFRSDDFWKPISQDLNQVAQRLDLLRPVDATDEQGESTEEAYSTHEPQMQEQPS